VVKVPFKNNPYQSKWQKNNSAVFFTKKQSANALKNKPQRRREHKEHKF